jgi:exodeoxyribonuclease VII large subunit
VVIYPCLVQGEQAPASIVAALAQAAQRAEVDTLLLVRGGGSLEDLWAFNDERVVRAVAASPVPVICGVGHETDVTLSDLAADLRAPTPTAAAELATPLREDALSQLGLLARRLAQAASRHTERQAQRLDLLGQRAGRPGAILRTQAARLDSLSRGIQTSLYSRLRLAQVFLPALADRLSRSAAAGIERRQLHIDHLAARLESVHPRQVLHRGYAWLMDAQGRPVLRAASLQPGQSVQAVLSDGQASALIESVHVDPQDESGSSASRAGN